MNYDIWRQPDKDDEFDGNEEHRREFHIAWDFPERLIGATEILSRRKEISVSFDYPLGATFEFSLKRRGKGITKRALVSFIQRTYRKIYSNDEKYSIWGHCIEDLVLAKYPS